MRCQRPGAVARALLTAFFGCLLLSLALTGPVAAKPRHYDKLFAAAENHVAAGRIEPALIAFADAAKSDPTRKEPWVRSAQLLFDAGRYGRAIVAAEEVLQRDPQDRVADSVLTIAGMRLAGQSLQRLQASGALAVSETALKEAQQLAGAVRETLDKSSPEADKPAPPPSRGRRPKRRSAAREAATASEPAATSPRNPVRAAESAPRTPPRTGGGAANPFEALGR